MTAASHFILDVEDQARSAAFYRRVLDREPRLDVPGMTEIALPGGAILGLMPEASIQRLLGPALPKFEGAERPARAELYLVVPDAAALHARAVAAGARELSPMQTRDWGHVAGYSLDPDGHVLAFATDPTATGVEEAKAVSPHQHLALVAIVVRDYDEALAFYVGTLGFELVCDEPVPAQGKRWVEIAPPGGQGTKLLLARASTAHQESRIGDQTGGRVFLFLFTDDVARDVARYRAGGVEFVREPRVEPYGEVAVFRDLHGNLWDLVQPARKASAIG